ncbi:glycosyltransferase [Akkermansiaceae bacterium]|nr:glycosyltransferase [Akkermansiaceae bacterium]
MVLYYRHFNDCGGVPDEIRAYHKYNSEKVHEIVTSRFRILRKVICSPETKFLFIGFFFLEYPLLWILCRIFKKEITIWPLGQLSDFSINRTLFPKSPIISDLSTNESTNRPKPKLNHTKFFFIRLSKYIINCNKTCFWFFSEFERLHLSTSFDKVKTFKRQLWVAQNNVKHYGKRSNLSQKCVSRPTLLCWARLDVFTKGIDRFKEYTMSVNKRHRNFVNAICCGPFYAGDREILESTENWTIIDTLKDEKKINFNDADFIVLFSRWDGFPRVLRESLRSEIPIIVSEETHFSEIINDFKVGIVVSDFSSDQNYDDLINFELSKANFEGALRLINEY